MIPLIIGDLGETGAINPYFVYNINISLKSVFKIHGANLPHYHCQLTPLVGHVSKYEKLKKPEKKLKKLYQLAQPSPSVQYDLKVSYV
ncbi:hypothetical protein OUZ56_011851 [Daphnia magna]|uniref:Uncharacterized protein n=1 Tax=Daphnia magna TaxID=35525 RepID=A0ABQ9Z1K8_9CRUS|nr:hypothetical protein OUZ56_011851 [Daphnia magna]